MFKPNGTCPTWSRLLAQQNALRITWRKASLFNSHHACIQSHHCFPLPPLYQSTTTESRVRLKIAIQALWPKKKKKKTRKRILAIIITLIKPRGTTQHSDISWDVALLWLTSVHSFFIVICWRVLFCNPQDDPYRDERLKFEQCLAEYPSMKRKHCLCVLSFQI